MFDDSAAVTPVRLAILFAALLTANVLAWLWAWTAFADRPSMLGTALLAWILGLRHAVDADHIAAIDNVVRKLMHDGRQPILAGSFFSLGHSTVVVLAAATVAATAAAFQAPLQATPMLGSAIGTAVSAAFLLAIALLNIGILCGIWRRFRAATRRVPLDATEMNKLLAGRGLLARLLRPVFRTVTRSWHMFPLGLLFGLGFDTATEVGLLGLSATQAAQGISPWLVMVFPALFTAGMALVDSADSALMVGAYGWALEQPRRKLWYDLTLTATSVVVAVLIGGIEALGLLADRLDLNGGVWSRVKALANDGTWLGLTIIGAFLLVWLLSAVLYRWCAERPAAAGPRAE